MNGLPEIKKMNKEAQERYEKKRPWYNIFSDAPQLCQECYVTRDKPICLFCTFNFKFKDPGDGSKS